MDGMNFILIRKTTGYVHCNERNEPLGFESMSMAMDWLQANKLEPQQWRIATLHRVTAHETGTLRATKP